MPLTDSTCRNAKPKEKQYKLTDGGGVYLIDRASGKPVPKLIVRDDDGAPMVVAGTFVKKVATRR